MRRGPDWLAPVWEEEYDWAKRWMEVMDHPPIPRKSEPESGSTMFGGRRFSRKRSVRSVAAPECL